ncbi:OmpA family protein [Pseudooceanicola sp. 216_PA32_1]|uniref:OmpA family protein n=1 Tax=Pseudooceanicola pacificus TaxID=2676438 RepID=A0A844W754_9RHOB|nr:flagellar motor protein MotB [Pseudooceanicola pacificus]MWB76543.1 OmpA family protein [Pseudooceanicola pacificus]
MSGQSNAAPVIIKRKKIVAGGGHHGGAWKVAYADFVTAMMAFFLLMWLLNATTEKQRKGIADYFAPTVPINRVSGGGDGAFSGDSVMSDMSLARNGTGASSLHATAQNRARGESGLSTTGGEEVMMEEIRREVEEALQGRGGESSVIDNLLEHIVTRVTDEGLVIDIFDLPGDPLFDGHTARPKELLSEIARLVARSIDWIANPVAVEAHVAARPVVLRDNPVWELSSERAVAMRDLLVRKGLARDRTERVTGHADREPVTGDPMALRNNRLEIILIRLPPP